MQWSIITRVNNYTGSSGIVNTGNILKKGMCICICVCTYTFDCDYILKQRSQYAATHPVHLWILQWAGH
ncbi:hypothetical protein BDD12DRAFT_853424 [Trichophaea hybrida]|nr:hypothetical protein BDD12DRAFT_853424 [Trichophaea hybrida]